MDKKTKRISAFNVDEKTHEGLMQLAKSDNRTLKELLQHLCYLLVEEPRELRMYIRKLNCNRRRFT